jgi:PAS domain S-box-containing protein
MAQNQANILLVDDNPANLLALEAILDGPSRLLVKAASGEEALRLLEEGDFAVVLLDVRMHGLDGFETARRIRARERSGHTPIIFLTAHDDNRLSVEEAYSLGAVDYLVKPLVPVILRAKVAGFVELFEKTEQVKRQAEQLRLLERQQFERRLEEENARFRALTENSSDAVTLISPDGTVLYTTPASSRVLGYAHGEFLGRSGFEVVHPDDQGRARGLLAELTGRPRATATAELRARHHDGSWRWVECVATNLLGDPAVGAVVVNFRDIEERHRATEALRESERRFSRFMQHLPGLAWIKDACGRYLYANDAAVRAFHTPREELYGKVDEDVFPPETAAQFRENDRRALADESGLQVIETLRHDDGVLHHSLVSKFPIPGPEGGEDPLVGGVAIDITDQVLTRTVLEESERRFRQLAENINEVFWVSDPDKTQVLYVSPAYEQVWGRSCRSLYEQPRSFLDAVNPEDRERVVAPSLERQRRGEASEVEYRVIRPDGSVRRVRDRAFPVKDASGRVYRIAGVAEDVTARKLAEEELRQRAEETEKLLDLLPLGVFFAHDPACRRITGNRAGYELLRLPVGSNLSVTPLPGEEPPFVVRRDGKPLPPEELPMQRAAVTGAEVRGVEVEHVYPDGTTRTLYGSASPLLDAQGKVRGCVGSFLDITDRKRMEAELRQRVEQLAEADRRKDEFLALLGHELRNPLTPIRNAVQVMRLLGPDPGGSGGVSPPTLRAGSGGVNPPTLRDEDLRRARDMIDRQVQHLTRMVDELLDVSRIQRGKVRLRPERLDLARLARLVADDFRATAEKAGVALELDLPGTPVWVEGDPTRLTQVLANLLQNAVKFSDGDSRVTVAVRADRGCGPAVLSVRDNGSGIEPGLLPGLFESFAQADRSLDRSKGGLGLGLALVKGLVELHGGTVEACSEGPGRGSEFLVRLPAQPEPAAITPRPEPPPRARKRLRILVVEDNPDAADSLKMLLELSGYEVSVAYTGPEGVEAAKGWRPDVVLCDIGLPGLDGYGVVRELRRNPGTARARVIAVTGYGGEEDRHKCQEAGFDAHLTKPADPSMLQELLAPGAGPP